MVETLLSFTRVSVSAQSKRFHIATTDSARLSHSPSLLLFSLVFVTAIDSIFCTLDARPCIENVHLFLS